MLTPDKIAERFRVALPGWDATVEPRTTLRQQHFAQERDKWSGGAGVPEATWYTIQRAPIWQQIVDESFAQRDDFTGLEQDWASLVKKEPFDPTRQPDWTHYGYQRGRDGRWHAAGSDYWKDRKKVNA